MSRRALVVEDDRDTRLLVGELLRREGIAVEEATSGAAALAFLERRGHELDLVVLDLRLPDGDGLDVLERLRQSSGVPVLVVSGKTGGWLRVRALDLGADDYVTKPYDPEELAARIRALLRRWRPQAPLELGPLVVDGEGRRAWVRGVELALPPREFDLLLFFARHPAVVHSREELLRAVWGSSTRWQLASTVTEHVRRLRVRLQALEPTAVDWFTAVRGLGYRFDPP